MKRHALGFVCSVAVALAAGPVPAFASGEATRVGDVDTTFRVVGRNDKIVVDRYDDPRVDGVSCYLSRANPAACPRPSGWPPTQAGFPSPAARLGR